MQSVKASKSAVTAVVTVGNELLYGETVDTNAAWLARSLASLGLPVVRKLTVGDVASEIQLAVRSAMDAADLVVERVVDRHLAVHVDRQPPGAAEIGVAGAVLRAAGVRRAEVRRGSAAGQLRSPVY